VKARILFLLGFLAACGQTNAAVDASDESQRAQALLAADAILPARGETLALAHSVEAAAAREGAGARAVQLHTTAGRLFERLWRLEHAPQDAKEADVAYDMAAHDPNAEGSCDASLRRALLAGDVAADAETTYKELYRTSKRFALPAVGSAKDAAAPAPGLSDCLRRADEQMASLAAFRPPPKVLEAVDQALAAEGTIGALPTPSAPSGPPKIVRIEQWPGTEAARVVVVLDRQATFRTGDEASAGGRKPRVFVELDGVDKGSAREALGGGIVTHVGVEATTTGTRVSFELDGPAYRRTFFLLEPYRIVIDVARHPPGIGRRHVAKVVLDPGHGGSDAGAVGPTGVKEKDVVLDIAHKVAPVLTKDGISVVLTRDDDRSVTLEERTARANQVGADLFVSVHCNAAENHVRRGVETYVLDTTKDEIAGRIAARENATSQAATAELGSILASLRLADQASHSNRLGELLQKSAMASLRGTYSDVTDGGVHTAGFYVLVGARMPAVLFETSYISHPTEEARLASEDYKGRLADAIVNAVRAYREGR
jgi:N-acetylmuramoyl-L-alanine amidase